MTNDKRLTETHASHVLTGCMITGYEMHIGRSKGPDSARPFARINGQNEGAINLDGRVVGSYLHGIFRGDDFRQAWLASFGITGSNVIYAEAVDLVLNDLADWLENHLDISAILKCAR